MINLTLGGRKCFICSHGTDGPIFLWGMHEWHGGEAETLAAEFCSLCPGKPFVLFAFDTEKWDDDFSPWKMTHGGRCFGGNGNDTLKWIIDHVLPYLDNFFPYTTERYIIGYSLAGLFALWSAYETNVFDGAASCSGSLWFSGFFEYLCKKNHRQLCVYLSLGGREANTPDELMATIGKKTKAVYDIMNADNAITNTVYEMNKGGHFANAEKRLAKGMAWLYNNR